MPRRGRRKGLILKRCHEGSVWTERKVMKGFPGDFRKIR